ncbi:MAG: D-alanine--D-alanine ligase [Patescibacteria group bacterium]
MKKLKIGIIFGGKSAEHEISLKSAANILKAIDKEKYEPILIKIDKGGRWLLGDSADLFEKTNKANPENELVLIPFRDSEHPDESGGRLINLRGDQTKITIDVAFPILHGPYGEDGTIQGLLKLADIPFVGAGVLGSAVGMDKDVMKRLLRDSNIPIAKFIAGLKTEIPTYPEIVKTLGSPFFVKPANLGSSVGISKVREEKDFAPALREAFSYDQKIIIEENIIGREIECSVLGNDDPLASLPGEIIFNQDFYSYETKYLDANATTLEIPAKLSEEIIKKIQTLAIKTFRVLSCAGFGRVDMFLKKNEEILVNEINTIPGFTASSMYPKLWEASGLSYTDLIDRLIQLALERHEQEKKLKTSY